MSVLIMGLVWNMPLPPTERFILMAYADHADHNGNNVYPSISKIAAKTGYSTRTVKAVTKKLIASGYLVRVRDGGQGAGDTNEYCIRLPGNTDPVPKSRKGDPRSPIKEGKGDPRSLLRVIHDHPIRQLEPSINTNTIANTADAGSPKALPGLEDIGTPAKDVPPPQPVTLPPAHKKRTRTPSSAGGQSVAPETRNAIFDLITLKLWQLPPQTRNGSASLAGKWIKHLLAAFPDITPARVEDVIARYQASANGHSKDLRDMDKFLALFDKFRPAGEHFEGEQWSSESNGDRFMYLNGEVCIWHYKLGFIPLSIMEQLENEQ